MDESLQAPAQASPKRRAKFVVGAVTVALAVVGLMVWAMARPGSTAFYLSVSEIQAMGPTEPAQDYRVNGDVVPDSIERSGLVTEFEITDGTGTIEVTTDRPLPDAFYSDTDRVEVVALGDFDGSRFVASEVFAKCPSKFKAKA